MIGVQPIATSPLKLLFWQQTVCAEQEPADPSERTYEGFSLHIVERNREGVLTSIGEQVIPIGISVPWRTTPRRPKRPAALLESEL